MARRTVGGNGASTPFTLRHRISFNSKSSTRSYSLKSILFERPTPYDAFVFFSSRSTWAFSTSVNGVTQKPVEGVSMVYSFADAKAKGNRKTQYCEMFGNRAIYDNGWIATCRHGRLPWENIGSYDFDKDEWQLYNLNDDFSEANDLAAKNPQKLKELQDLFWIEATKYNVLPLDDRFIERADPDMRPSLIEGRTKFT